jgi:hypothetical protein
MVRFFEFHFTADEVDARSYFTGDPAVLKLVPKNGAAIPGKFPYTELVKEKVSALVPNHSDFSINLGWNPAADGLRMRNYVLCNCVPKKKSPITYIIADLQPQTPLKFTVKIICTNCLRDPAEQAAAQQIEVIHIPADPIVLPQAPQASVFGAGIPAIGIVQPHPMKPVLNKVSEHFSAIVNSIDNACGGKQDAEAYFLANQERFFGMFQRAWNSAVATVPGFQPEALNDQADNNEGEENEENNPDPLQIVNPAQQQQNVNATCVNAFDRMMPVRNNQAARRIREQQEAVVRQQQQQGDIN